MTCQLPVSRRVALKLISAAKAAPAVTEGSGMLHPQMQTTGDDTEDPMQSVLNRFHQRHGVDRVFIVDGSSFPTASEENSTFTISAQPSPAGDDLADELSAGRR